MVQRTQIFVASEQAFEIEVQRTVILEHRWRKFVICAVFLVEFANLELSQLAQICNLCHVFGRICKFGARWLEPNGNKKDHQIEIVVQPGSDFVSELFILKIKLLPQKIENETISTFCYFNDIPHRKEFWGQY